MVNHCANPICHKRLHYLREGKVFLFSRKNGSPSTESKPLEHFWLCGVCAKEWTLKSDAKTGVQLVKARHPSMRAGYAITEAAQAS